MSVNVKTAKKVGLVSAVAVLIGSVIGIGIFFKNGGVFANNNNNPYGVLISWILASVISLLTAFSFAEVGFNHRDGAGLAGCCERMFGHKFGRFIAFNNSFFYFGILNLAVAIFCAESIVKIFIPSGTNITAVMHIGYVMLIGLALVVIFVAFNYLGTKYSQYFQVLTTGLKFLPLIIVGLAGIIYGAMNPNLGLFSPNPTNVEGKPVVVGTISIDGILSSLPAILFAYDSFLGVASLQGEMENPKKKVPLTIVLGMGICISLYLFITLGQIMVGSGTAGGVFDTIFSNNPTAKQAFSVVISLFIFISAVGCLNSLVLVGLRTFTFSIQYRIFYGSWYLNEHSTDGNKTGMILSAFIYGFWWIVFLIPSVILNTDAIIDGASNFPTLFMFAIYGTVILKTWINRFTKKVHVNKMNGFIVIAPLASLGCYLAFGYQFFYYYSTKIIIDGITNQNWFSSTVNWGLFATGPEKLSAIYAMLVFFISIFIFIVFPFINDALIKEKYHKINAHDILKEELLV